MFKLVLEKVEEPEIKLPTSLVSGFRSVPPKGSEAIWTKQHVFLLACTCDFPGKNTGEGCHFLLQGIFLTQELNPCLLLGRWILYHWAIWEASVSNVILQIMVSHYMYVCVCIYIHTHTIYSFSIHLWRNTSCFCILVIVNSAAWTELFKQLKAKS